MVSTRLIEQDSFGPSAALVEHFLVAIEHKKPIWWYSVVRGFRTSSQDPGWSEALAAVEAARNVSAEFWAAVPTAILQAAQRPRRDALVETEMADAAGGATIAAASALTVKHLLDERAFQLLLPTALLSVRAAGPDGESMASWRAANSLVTVPS
jgi:hypothetical protein